VGAGHGTRRRGGVEGTALRIHGAGLDGGGGSDELGSKRVRDAVRREEAWRRDGRAMLRCAAGGKWARGRGKYLVGAVGSGEQLWEAGEQRVQSAGARRIAVGGTSESDAGELRRRHHSRTVVS
jgi:hypothetical protein